MERISRIRAIAMLLIVAMILVLFSARLFSMQIIETKGDTDNTQTYTTLTRVKAARGDILDRNGNILVGNRASYDLMFNHYVIKSADNRNEHLYKLIKKCQELGIEYNDHFPVSKTYPFVYTLDSYNTSWNSYFQKYMVDRSLDSDISAPLLMSTLKERYDIPETWSEEDARAVIGLRYEFDLRGVVGTLSNYVFLEDISDEHLSILLEMNIPGLMVESSTVREYYTTYAAHILGSVGAIDADEWAYYDDLDYAMDAYVGKSGFEQAFEADLRAIDGTRVDVVDKNGTIISQYYANIYDKNKNIIGQQVPQAGANVETTIDIELQKIAEDSLAKLMKQLRDPMVNTSGEGLDAEGAAVVVMDVKTGQVLVCASYPTFDLATLNDNYSTVEQADFAPLFNRALSAAYPPGSTYKMVTLTSAMMNGKYLLDEEIIAEGVFTKYDNFRPTCMIWSNNPGVTHKKIDGTPGIDATIALEVSCNYFFYELGDRVTITQLDATAKGFGLGEHTGIELPETTGHRSNPETKAEQYKGMLTSWYTGDKILTAIGQSENRFTPMQLCVYASTLANKGTRLKATFLSRVVSSDYRTLVRESSPEILSTMEIDEVTYMTYMQGMRQVISGPRGTGRDCFGGAKDWIGDSNGLWPYPEIEVCAKTGTAETFKDRSDNGAYICFAPMNDPQIAIAIYAERGAHGSTFAVVAEEIMKAYFSLGDSGDVIVQENRLG